MLSFLKRKDSPAAASAADEATSVRAARARARRRLIGAAVLIGVGIIGFPLLFETQPRPIAVDIPIELPARDNAPSSKAPAAKVAATPPPATAPVVAETVAEPAVEPSVPASAASTMSQAQRAERVASAADPAPASPSAARTAAPAADPRAEAQRAQALLEGKPVAAVAVAAASEPKAGRFVVQAGAYTDATTLRDARQKVEKLGLKTYTQVVETESGARTRVRVGPFDSRDEAERAAARIKGSGLAANILSL